MQFPVWRELKQFILLFWLKLRISVLSFECSFPFEGNWNIASGMCMSERSAKVAKMFECSFPFEGNWNSFQRDSLSRLAKISLVWMQFPVWRELKRGGPLSAVHGLPIRLNAVSRLKGIETSTKAKKRHVLPNEFPSLNAVSRLKGIETDASATPMARL